MDITLSQEGMKPITISTGSSSVGTNIRSAESGADAAPMSPGALHDELLKKQMEEQEANRLEDEHVANTPTEQGFSGLDGNSLDPGVDSLTGIPNNQLSPETVQDAVNNDNLPQETYDAMKDPNAMTYDPSMEQPAAEPEQPSSPSGFDLSGQYVNSDGNWTSTPNVNLAGQDFVNQASANQQAAANADLRKRAEDLRHQNFISAADNAVSKRGDWEDARDQSQKSIKNLIDARGHVPSDAEAGLAKMARDDTSRSDAAYDDWQRAKDEVYKVDSKPIEEYEEDVKRGDTLAANKANQANLPTREDAEKNYYRSKKNQAVYDAQKEADAARAKLADMELDPNTSADEIAAQKDAVNNLQRKVNDTKNETPKYGIPDSQAAAMSGYRNDDANQRRMPSVGGAPSNPKAGLASNTEGVVEPPATTAAKEKQAEKQAKVIDNVAKETEVMRKARAASGHVPSMDPTIEEQRQANEVDKANRALKEREILNTMIMNGAPDDVIEQQKKVLAQYDPKPMKPSSAGMPANVAYHNAFGNGMPGAVQEMYDNNNDKGSRLASPDKIAEINKSRQATGTNPLAKPSLADRASGVAGGIASAATNPENLKKAGGAAAILVAANLFLRHVLGGTVFNAATSIGKFRSGKEMLNSPKLNQNLAKIARKYQKPYPTVDEVKADPKAKTKETFMAWLLSGQTSNKKISNQIGSSGTLVKQSQIGVPVAITTLSPANSQALQQLAGNKIAIATAFFKKNGQIVSEPVARGFLAKGSMVNASLESADIFFNARGQKFNKDQINYLASKSYESFGPNPEFEAKIIDWYCL